MEKPSADLVALYEELIANRPIDSRMMFGSPCGFINANMQSGVHAQTMFVRLGEDDRAKFLRQPNTSLFEPMPGRPMKDYVAFVEPLEEDLANLEKWLDTSVSYTLTLPPKVKKK
ncbi:MAG TPA: TfoX/Sxy family protein [Candidatus Nanoarchaeia archaeon]|nr:TfoX/Sxy family protein [Candidatus Nanoarchaeia archaeon]